MIKKFSTGAALIALTVFGASCAEEPAVDATPAETPAVTATDDSATTSMSDASTGHVPALHQQFTDRAIPRFAVDAAWPELPDELILGQMPGVSVAPDDTIWVIQRPNSLGFSDLGAAQEPPIAVCCEAAPHVLHFAQDGSYLGGFGGPELTPSLADGTVQWPANVHGIYADGETIWIGGNGDGDHVVLNFTPEGEFIAAYGERGQTDGNASATRLGNPADIHFDPETDEILIADGYINKRIVGWERGAEEASRLFGAYGSAPGGGTREGTFDQSQASSNADGGADLEAETFGDIVHCVAKGPDDRIYVCDRRNNRIQVFETGADGETAFVTDIAVTPETGGTRSASDIAWSPDGAFMYVADMMNGQVWILDGETYEFLGAVGKNGRYPGQFIWLHSVDVDSDGNLYTTEVNTGRRVQKFVFQGVN